VTDNAFIAEALTAARPRAMSALVRYFRDLDRAEEAFQDACLRALRTWPVKGPPRDPTAWLVLVGRNAGLDGVRRAQRTQVLPAEDRISDLDDVETPMVERLDEAHYRDDVLRLLFVCCHPDLPDTGRIALALRIVCGLSLGQIARAFLVSEAAMEQRITRAKARIAKADVPFEAPSAEERAERLGAVAAMVYLVFNEGYSAPAASPTTELAEEAIRLGRLLLRLYQSDPEVMGLLALMLLQHARRRARRDARGEVVLLEEQDRAMWDAGPIAEGLALIDKAMRHRRPGPYQIQAAIAGLHARATRAADTDWAGIEALYQALERVSPSPVVSLNRAVALAKVRGPAAALALITPLEARLCGYFHYFGVKGAMLTQLGRAREAREAFDRAIALAADPAQAAHIRRHLDQLAADAGGPDCLAGGVGPAPREPSLPHNHGAQDD
jgi:RNA polymerase sigma-70 factor (ECF subfamily)